MTDREFINLLMDAEAHPDRLTAWEQDFMQNVSVRDADSLTEKQLQVLKTIERKLYAT